MTVDPDRTYGADFVPSFARKFVGATIDLVAARGVVEPDRREVRALHPRQARRDAPAAPASPSPAPTPSSPSPGDVRVSIPLVGGKLEDLIAGLMRDAFHAENKVGLKWLAGEWRV